VVNKTGALCPECGGDLVERKTRQKKRIFYGCNNYPACNFAIWEKPIPDPCPQCSGLMVVPKPNQDPVCYREVIVPQRAKEKEERPHQAGEAKTAEKKPTARRATSTRAKASTATTAKKATTTRKTAASTAKKSTAQKTTTAKKATATRKAATTGRTVASTVKKASASSRTASE